MADRKPGNAEEKAKGLVAELVNQVMDLTEPDGFYAYRGQEDESWEVKSAASRRLKEEDLSVVDVVKYHKQEILEPARMDGHGFKDGRKLSDLELLADLQHNGAATCLIDFTRNFLAALWFACKDAETKKEKKIKNGKIFILNTKDRDVFQSLEQDDLEHIGGIEAILNFTTRATKEKDKRREPDTYYPLYWHWSPHGMNQRILKQDSLFIFGEQKIKSENLQEISVSKENKLDVLKELRRLGVTEDSLFKDVQGFAALHGVNKRLSMKPPTAKTYLEQGNEAFQRGDYLTAMQRYDQAIELKSNYADAYFYRGNIKYILKNYKEAIEDYSKAIKFKLNYVRAYYNRGVTKDEMGMYSEAIKDYDKVIELDPKHAAAYNNRGADRIDLGKYVEAKKDFDQAIKHKKDYTLAYCNRAEANLKLGDKDGARKDFLRAKKLAEVQGKERLLKEINQHLSELGGEGADK